MQGTRMPWLHWPLLGCPLTLSPRNCLGALFTGGRGSCIYGTASQRPHDKSDQVGFGDQSAESLSALFRLRLGAEEV
jgi:hypothetical protein